MKNSESNMRTDHCERISFNVDAITYMDGLYGYARVLARDPIDAVELVQETYVRAIRAAARLQNESNVKAWFFTIMRNIWRNELRRQHKAPQAVEMMMDEYSVANTESRGVPYLECLRKADRDQVRAAIEQLPEDFREIILLREYEQMSYQEISAILNCPPGTVMSRLASARTKLRTVLYEVLQASDCNR
jgi:RNA polymerase sigma-70 factor (ECF subfamily)